MEHKDDTNTEHAASVPCRGVVDVLSDEAARDSERVSSADEVVLLCIRRSSELYFTSETAAIVHKE